ncbi:hypothetical protein BASA62_006376 [Batrachochytrium salamandrivorans]|nr:hypothetical protein BASA62_006376 [Batrachochytrium salamandrivorans]
MWIDTAGTLPAGKSANPCAQLPDEANHMDVSVVEAGCKALDDSKSSFNVSILDFISTILHAQGLVSIRLLLSYAISHLEPSPCDSVSNYSFAL